MKRKLYNALLVAAVTFMGASCNNGDYVASPATNTNNGVNPVTPLTQSEFTWTGQEPVSADINGVHWKADAASFALDSGINVIVATKGNQVMYFKLADSWANNLYDMSFGNYKRYSYYTDSSIYSPHYSFSNLGNSGEVYMIENDSAYISGKFYYKGVNQAGQAVIINNGYFKVKKY